MIYKFINIEDLLYTFKKKFWIIIVITIATTIFGIYRVSKLQPSYVANAKVFIGKGSELVEYYSKEEVDNIAFSELSFINCLLRQKSEHNIIAERFLLRYIHPSSFDYLILFF